MHVITPGKTMAGLCAVSAVIANRHNEPVSSNCPHGYKYRIWEIRRGVRTVSLAKGRERIKKHIHTQSWAGKR